MFITTKASFDMNTNKSTFELRIATIGTERYPDLLNTYIKAFDMFVEECENSKLIVDDITYYIRKLENAIVVDVEIYENATLKNAVRNNHKVVEDITKRVNEIYRIMKIAIKAIGV